MKKLIFLISLLYIGIGSVQSQILLEENFGTFPPSGWTTEDFTYEHWATNYNTPLAGGKYPECVLEWYPGADNGTARLISKALDFSSYSTIMLSFKHKLIWKNNTANIGVATRANSSAAWNIVWDKVTDVTIGPETKQITISNADLQSSTFQFCLFYTGSFENMSGWYIDDIIIEKAPDVDINILDIVEDFQYKAGDVYVPTATLQNLGINTETFNVSCSIIDVETGGELYSKSINKSIDKLEEKNVIFPNFNITENGKAYSITVSHDLSTDEVPANDTRTEHINTWTIEKQNVLLEIGTYLTCPNCPSAALGADKLNEDHKVSVIEHHSSSSDQQYTNTDAQARLGHLGVNAFPTSYFDLHKSKIGGCIDCYQPFLEKFNEAYTFRSPINITINASKLTQGIFNVDVTIKKLEPLANKNLRLILTLTESHIDQVWGTNPKLNQLNFVNRKMYPNSDGLIIDLTQQNSLTKTYTVDANKYNLDNCQLIAFVEDPKKGYVYQTEEFNLSTILTVEDIKNKTDIKVYPNPSTDILNISMGIDNATNSKYIISTIYGSKVREDNLINGTNTIDVSMLSDGYYFLKIKTNDTEIVKKICIIN